MYGEDELESQSPGSGLVGRQGGPQLEGPDSARAWERPAPAPPVAAGSGLGPNNGPGPLALGRAGSPSRAHKGAEPPPGPYAGAALLACPARPTVDTVLHGG